MSGSRWSELSHLLPDHEHLLAVVWVGGNSTDFLSDG
jgi:hypothetical protein